MTIAEALTQLTVYPIPALTVEKLCTVRGLVITDTFDQTVATSDAYRLAEADAYMWLYASPNGLSEQEVSFTQAEADNFLFLANKIYSELEDPAFTGSSIGYVGEDYNG